MVLWPAVKYKRDKTNSISKKFKLSVAAVRSRKQVRLFGTSIFCAEPYIIRSSCTSTSTSWGRFANAYQHILGCLQEPLSVVLNQSTSDLSDLGHTHVGSSMCSFTLWLHIDNSPLTYKNRSGHTDITLEW